MQGGSSLFAFPLGLFAAEGLGQRWLKHHRHLRLVTLKMHSSYSVDTAVNILSPKLLRPCNIIQPLFWKEEG